MIFVDQLCCFYLSKTFRLYGLRVLLFFILFFNVEISYPQKVQILPDSLSYPFVSELFHPDSLSIYISHGVVNLIPFVSNYVLKVGDDSLSRWRSIDLKGSGYSKRFGEGTEILGYEEVQNQGGFLDHGVLEKNLTDHYVKRIVFKSDTAVTLLDWHPKVNVLDDRNYFIGRRTRVVSGLAQSADADLCLAILSKHLQVEHMMYWNINGLQYFIDLVLENQNIYLIFRVRYIPPSFPGIGNGGNDIAIMKITNDTTIQWLRTYGTPNSESFTPFYAQNYGVFHNGHLYFQFRCGTGTCLMKIDEDGNLVDSKEYSINGYDGFYQHTLNVRPGHNELVHTGLVQEFATGNLVQNGGLIVFDEDLNVKQARKIGTPTGEDYILQSLVFFDDGSFVSTAGASTYYGGPLLFYSDENLNTGCLDMGPLEVTVQDYPMNVLDYMFPTLHHVGWHYDTLYTTTDTYTMTDACYCEGDIDSATAGLDTTICQGTFTWLGSAQNPPELIYQWSPGTGLENPNSGFTRAAPQQTTTYTLTVIDTTGLNCYRSVQHRVTIQVRECETGQFEVMPSPNNGTFNLHHGAFFGHTNIDLMVYDVRGRLVWQQKLSGQQTDTVVELPPLVATGMYVVRAKSEKLEREAKMVVMK